MKKHYFLGLAANFTRDERILHTFAMGRKEDLKDLEDYLLRKYGGEKAILAKNGRSALALALKAYFDEGDEIIVNGFTCYAVYEAVKAAGLKPVFVDISLNDLNYTEESLALAKSAKGIIVQNTLGNPVDINMVEKFAEERGLIIIEDLAHCAGVKYADGREAGTVGAAAVFSFGKDKSIDTVSGGAVVLRYPYKNPIGAPRVRPKLSDHLRARFYPMFGATCRTLSYLHLGGVMMRLLIKVHWVERSADNKLDLERRLSKFEAKRALMQIKSLSRAGEKPLREFYFVRNRQEVLAKLAKAGYYFSGFWYEKPVSPERYYKKVHFPEEECPNAVYASEHIVNLPRYYRKRELEPARKIIKEYLEETE
ncbi:DegT/DnrJ/EryC1/StrS family aminotransferase [Candidatus Saccharibacteria bacterium]|nr:DegT/DnrJ/EryC1/StrS family aminotransferase [Candidatus Saccharibacteria bacterium]